jgi:hypothetical protein
VSFNDFYKMKTFSIVSIDKLPEKMSNITKTSNYWYLFIFGVDIL